MLHLCSVALLLCALGGSSILSPSRVLASAQTQAVEPGLVMLPRGDVFCPLIADPKNVRSFMSLLRTDSSQFDGSIAAVGIGDDFGLLRWTDAESGLGLQVGIEAGIFSQFDLQTQGLILTNSDYIAGIPVTYRRGSTAARLRVYHQSSHLGDDFLLQREIERRRLSFESVELLLSKTFGPLRLYGGGETLLYRKPSDLGTKLLHFGSELHTNESSPAKGPFGATRFVAGLDFKSLRRQSWSAVWSGRLGVELRSAKVGALLPSRFALLFEFYRGMSPFGQFYREKLSYTGLGIHFAQ